MNIKIVYNTKTHKISPKHQTLEDIKKVIQTIYPQQLEGGFDLYVTLHPQKDPYKILDDSCFLRIKVLYNQLKWSSIKFLVKDAINPNLTNDDLSILNQSVIAQSNVQLSTFNDLFQQKPQPQQEEIQPNKQNIVIEENKPDTQLAQLIINQIEKQEVFGLDYHSEEFKQFIIEQIDERLKYHGIFQNQIQNPKKLEYRMQVQTRDLQISKLVNEKFDLQIQIINTGDFIWIKNNVILIGVNGYYKNVLIQLEQDIHPGQTANFICHFQMPNYPVQNVQSEFQLVYHEENERKFFGEKVSLMITTLQKNVDQIKVKQLMENAEISKEKAIEFIQMYGADNPIDEIIIAYFQQPK